MSDAIVTVEAVHKRYGKVSARDGNNPVAARRTGFGLLRPNGAFVVQLNLIRLRSG